MSRPRELDDAQWLRRRYERDGDMAIALDLGVARGTLRAARERLGIAPQAPGRRRGVLVNVALIHPRAPAAQLPPVLEQLGRRYDQDSHHTGAPATWTTVLNRLAAADRARRRHDRTAELNAAIAVSSAAALVADHLEQVER